MADLKDPKKTNITPGIEAAEIRRFFRLFFQNSQDMVFCKDLKGIYLACNQTYADYLHKPIEEIIGKSDFDIVDRKRAIYFSEKDQIVEKYKEILSYEDWGIHPSGEKRLMETSKSPVIDKHGNVVAILAVSRDITEHRGVENDLRASEQKFHTLMEFAPMGFCLYDLEGNILDCNRALENITGLKKEQIIGKNIHLSRRISPEEKKIIRNRIEQNKLGNATLPDELTFVMPDGNKKVLEVSTCPITVSGLPSAIAVAQDITRRKASELAIRESEERYQQLADATFEAVFITKDEICLNVNKSAVSLFGYEPDELIGKSILKLVVKKNQAELIENFQCGKNEPHRLEMIRKNGDIFPVEIRTRSMRYKNESVRISAIRDITYQVKSETALRNSEEYFRNLIEHSTDVISILDTEGKIVFESPSHERVLGYPTGYLIDKDVFSRIHPDDVDRIKEMFHRLLSEPGRLEELHVRYKHFDGSWRFLEGMVSNLFHIERINGIVVNYRDNTQNRLLEEQLQQDQKMKAVGQLAGGIAHDFNNLLTVINGYCSLLSQKELDDGTVKAVSEIQKAGERAAGLTSQLLSFSRKQLIQPKVINLHHLIAEHNKMLPRLLGENIVIHAQLTAKNANVNIDSGQMEQVIMNIAINARDAMPLGGQLDISTKNQVITVGMSPNSRGIEPGEYIELDLADNGVGMDPDTAERIFEPFFTTKGRGKGTGLGLSMVYGIVKQFGGEIFVSSAKGQGSKFSIYLPVVQQIEDEKDMVSEPKNVLSGNEKILFVEDDAAVREVTKATLVDQGYQVYTAVDGRDGLRVYREMAGEIDLVLTDVIMPNLNGRQMAKQLQRQEPDLKILYLSGYTDDAISQYGVLEKHLHLLQKPFSAEELLKKIRSILDKG